MIKVTPMIALPHFTYRTPQEYLDWEAQQEFKHEYLDGEVYAMTGGSIPHNLISLNLASLLKSHLNGKGCRVFIADVKVKVALASSFHYPDVVVSCDRRDRNATQFIQHPCLIIEVLSPSTAGYDRGEKFRRYRQIPSLQDYVVVETNSMSIDRFSRTADSRWELYSYGEGNLVEFPSVQWQGAIDLLYEDISFETPESDAEENETDLESQP